MFNFRIITTAEGLEIIDRTLTTSSDLLNPFELMDYVALEDTLAFMDTPKNQYLPLPPNSKTKLHHSHGIHYIKIFPIIDKYVQTYLISEPFDLMIKNKIDDNEPIIVQACQDYLKQCENGNKHFMTPDIDGIIHMLDSQEDTN